MGNLLTMIPQDPEYDEGVVECKGLIYRASVNSYISDDGDYVHTERMRLLKRKSCKGCPQCGWYIDDINTGLSIGVLPYIENIENSGLYKLSVIITGKDMETGIVDDWDIVFDKYIEME